ncbi:MAG TPA: hypothetical protein VGK59_12815 [Ohtaekwangia sp.]
MFRKVLIIVILFSMTMHCFSRLGVMSYLFEKRHEIAYSLGLIAEIPIAVCNSDYDFTPGLAIQGTDDIQHLPLHISQAQEIILFFHTVSTNFLPGEPLTLTIAFDTREDSHYPSPLLSVFHPPSIG